MAEDRIAPASPSCPSCGGEMVLRTNSFDGSSFWGCPRFPACKGTRDIRQAEPDEQRGIAERAAPWVRVLWNDGTLARAGWQCRYTTAGGSLRGSQALKEVARELRQCWIARSATSYVAPEPVRRVTGAIRKIIQRGANPPVHPHVERELLESLGFDEHLRPSPLPGDLSIRLEPDVFRDVTVGETSVSSRRWEPDPEIRLESSQERRFLTEWVPANLGAAAPRWFVPQASLDDLTASLADQVPSGQRVDFLVTVPFGQPFVVEIDGPQHQRSTGPDRQKDRRLGSVGIPVVRIQASEIDQGSGQNLDRVRDLWPSAQPPANQAVVDALLMPPAIHRLVVALLDAVEAGFLQGKRWVVELESEPAIAPTRLWPYLRLFAAMDRLWGPAMMPEEIFLGTRGTWTRFDLVADATLIGSELGQPETEVTIRLQTDMTAVDRLGPPQGPGPEIVVRSAFLPVVVGDDLFEPSSRTNLLVTDPSDIEPALTEVLQAVFAKEAFRDGQLEALVEVLTGGDCTVLLPTGGGKSLIYQMAGICKPGRTLVVDPLIALMEDQQRGLAQHGIDKVVGFSIFQVVQGRLDEMLRRVTSGDALFIFAAPERFQQRRFREAIKSLTQATPINLAVIDEAHCVSEWGHQFRTSYLTLGRVLREVCKDTNGDSPPLLALTGTASRAVLKDVLTQLAIATDSERAIIRPASFDRPELELATRQCSPADSAVVLTGTLRALPSRFGVQPAEFFRPQGESTYSGLIFCPHVNGKHGILELQKASAAVVGFEPSIYSGSAPRQQGRARDWEQRKRTFAESFKSNRIPLMVSTNAFGMGIDKPNIRYVLHYGMPGSIEAYYQEVGRAGRDQKIARCLLIWSELDRTRSDRLTILDGSLEEVRQEHASIGRSDDDSITHQLFFLLDTFKGVEVEVAEVERVLDDPGFLPRLGSRSTVQLARGTEDGKDERLERALYRLMLLGVVEDYLIESSFVVNLARVSAQDVADSLVAFVRRTDPGAQRNAIADLAANASGLDLRTAVSLAARELIAFIYDVVVESRRRSLREMYVATRDSSSGGNDLRTRVLDYLTQGDISPVLEDLLEATEFDYTNWERELAKLEGVEDARELRGNAARLLASSPFNPGLLLARAYAEVIHPEGDLQDLTANLEASLSSAGERYGVSQPALSQFCGRLLQSLTSSAFHGLADVVDLIDRLGLAPEVIDEIYRLALEAPNGNIGVRVLAMANSMRVLKDSLNEISLGGVQSR